MGFKKKSGLLVGAGFLLGTVGVKALTSTTAKKCYVQGVAQGPVSYTHLTLPTILRV